MLPFIQPYQANILRNELNKLLRVFYFVGDFRVYQATKDELQATIHQMFGPLSHEQVQLFDGITEIKGQQELNDFMRRIQDYVIPFPFDSEGIRSLFKKEKKLSVPDVSEFDLGVMTYLGWRDISKNVIYMVYPYEGKMTGIKARYTTGSANSNVCCICNQALGGSEVGLVTTNTKASNYKSVGNYMCLDSIACNRRMTRVDSLEDFFRSALSSK